MIGYLLKNWKLLLDLILVVGGIIALTIFDPFSMFSKAKLKNTANLVSSVREIGELTTAEYFGEVVSSLHETKIYNVPADSLYDAFEECYLELRKITATTLYQEKRIRDRKWRMIEGSNDLDTLKIEYAGVYNSLLTFLAVNNLSGELSNYYNLRSKQIKSGTEKKVFQYLTKSFRAYRNGLNKDIEDITDLDLDAFVFDLPTNFTSITDFHYELKKEEIFRKKKERKRDIVFIGRGWVKAGFKFDQLNESNFYYDKNDKVIQFYGLTPSILDKDINPWFIPEEKIKGFELVDYYSDATFEEAVQVKKKCKEKLLEQATNADILTAAKDNGREALTNFFSLLLNEDDLTVEFLDYPFGEEYENIAADTLVTVSEALIVKALFEESLKKEKNLSQSEINRERNAFRLFMNRLKKLDFIKKGTRFTPLSMNTADVLEHELFLTQSEYDALKKIRDPLTYKNDTLRTAYMQRLWLYEDYNDFIRDFNEMLYTIDDVLSESAFLREDTLFIAESQRREQNLELHATYFDVFREIDKEIIEGDTIVGDTVLRVVHKFSDAPKFFNMRYPTFTLEPSMFEEISLINIEEVDSIIAARKNMARFISNDSTLNQTIEKDLDALFEYKKDSVEKSIKLRPVKSLTVGVKKLLN